MNKQIVKQRIKSSGISAGYCAIICICVSTLVWSVHSKFIEMYGTEFKFMDLTFNFFAQLFKNPVVALSAIGGFLVALAKAYSMFKSIRRSDQNGR